MSGINIKNEELVEKIRIIARRQGKGVTATLSELVDRELANSNRETVDENDPFVRRWLEAGKRSRERNRNALRSDQIDEFLYDEIGLPK